MTPKGQINRTGLVRFHDAKIRIWEEPSREEIQKPEWNRRFKKEVFTRIIQTLNRLGWKCEIPADLTERYGKRFALDYRSCSKGDLRAELEISGRSIELKFWQDVHNTNHPHGGKYEFGKEKRMSYLQFLEMNRTRNRIKNYLCNVFSGYKFEEPKKGIGPQQLTALEWVEQDTKDCYHYDTKLGRRSGESNPYNNRSIEGDRVHHGQQVWFFDHKDRLLTGTAYYSINNRWWVVTGKYSLFNKASFELSTRGPQILRKTHCFPLREKRLKDELKKAVEEMDFERAIILRDLLNNKNEPVPF